MPNNNRELYASTTNPRAFGCRYFREFFADVDRLPNTATTLDCVLKINQILDVLQTAFCIPGSSASSESSESSDSSSSTSV